MHGVMIDRFIRVDADDEVNQYFGKMSSYTDPIVSVSLHIAVDETFSMSSRNTGTNSIVRDNERNEREKETILDCMVACKRIFNSNCNDQRLRFIQDTVLFWT